MFFNQIAQRARDDIMDALRVRQMGMPNVQGIGVRPQQPQMPPMQPQGALPQASMPQMGLPQAQMNAGMPQAPMLPQPPQMPAIQGMGNAYGMQGALPIAQRPQGAPPPVRFARGGYIDMFRVR